MAAFAESVFHIVARELQIFKEDLVIDGPTAGEERAERVIRQNVVIPAVLHVDPDGLWLRLADDREHSVGALHRDERADETDDATELIGMFPRRHERAYRARAGA